MFEVLHDLNDWKMLGLQLGLPISTLIAIEKDTGGQIDDCKMKMLALWLRGATFAPPSWQVLQDALRKIGETELSDKIKMVS